MADDNKIIPFNLDASLDDIEDLPGFAVFPSGAYLVVCEKGGEQKEINEHPALQFELKLEEVLEMTETLGEDERPPQKGDISTQAFMLDNKFGAGRLKEFLTPIGKHLGINSIGGISEGMKGMTLMVVMTRTFNKEKQKYFQQIKKVAVP